MSSRQDLTVAQGDTVAESYVSNDELTGVPPTDDLATLEVVVKSSLEDADADAALELKSSGAGVTIVDANAWTYIVHMTSAETAGLTVGTYRWVATSIDAVGNTREAFRGRLTVRQRGGDPSS
jgi:hypothetical protein